MVRSTRITAPLLVLLVGIIGLVIFSYFRRIDEEYDISQSKEAMIEYINETTVPDSIFVMSSVSEMTKDQGLINKIFEEADKGDDEYDKEKLLELIKKI
jgi:hypothetical protein